MDQNQAPVGENEILRDHLTKLYTLAKDWALETAASKPRSSSEVEMAAYQARIKVLETTIADLQAIITEKQLENDDLLCYLHEAQETIERNLIPAPIKNDSMSSSTRLSKILEKEKSYIEADEFSLHPLRSEGRNVSNEWNLKNFILKDRMIEALRFKIVIESGLGWIEFLPIIENDIGAIRGFSQYDVFCPKENTTLKLLPQSGGAYTGTNAALSSLSIEAWTFLNHLIEKLHNYVCGPDVKNHLTNDEIMHTREGLNCLGLILKKWPEVFRYESISIEDIRIDTSGKTIELHLNHAGINNLRWDSVSFSITSMKGQNGEISPKIGFSKAKMPRLNYWQNSTEAANEETLEILFASPDDMDAEMWEKLGLEERMLIAGILSTASNQLNTISNLPNLGSIDWEDWYTSVQVMTRILRNYQASVVKVGNT